MKDVVGVVGSRRPVEVAPYHRRSRVSWMLGWAPRGGGVMEHGQRCRRRWTWPQSVSCRLNGEKEGSETSRVDSFRDAPCRSPTTWISPHALSTRRPFENPMLAHNFQVGGGAQHGAVRSCWKPLNAVALLGSGDDMAPTSLNKGRGGR